MTETPLVELSGVGVRIGSTQILRDVDLQITAGEVVGLFGANGAGKTTMLRLIATLIRPAQGQGTVLGADLSSAERYDVRRRIGMIGHVPGLYPELTLGENLRYAARVAGVPTEASRRSAWQPWDSPELPTAEPGHRPTGCSAAPSLHGNS